MPQEEGEMYVRLAQEALHLSPNPPLNWVFGFVRRIVAVVATLAYVLSHALLLRICK